MINETTIRCFLSLAQTLSFTQTAKKNYMTQQSVSKYIVKLEEELGFKLFTRTHHYVALTKAGENYYHLLKKFEEEFAQTTEKTRQYYNNMYNSLRIGYLEWLELSSGISAALKLCLQDHPQLHFTGEKYPREDLNELLSARKLDLIITYTRFTPKIQGLKRITLLETPVVLLVSPEHPLATAGSTLDDFRTQPFIQTASKSESAAESKSKALRLCREHGFKPTEIIVAPNLESAYMATEFGQGVLISTMLSRMSRRSELKCYPLHKNEELQCIWFENQENPMVGVFASCLEKIFQ